MVAILFGGAELWAILAEGIMRIICVKMFLIWVSSFYESQPQNPEYRNNPENFHSCKSSCADPGIFVSPQLILQKSNGLFQGRL